VSPAGAEIAVSLRADATTATIAISDSGPGIAPAALPRIFDRFYSEPGGASRGGNGSGTGLGLAIAREIARGHDGELRASNEPGAGATLTLELPRARVSAHPHRDLTDLLLDAHSVGDVPDPHPKEVRER
jgi:signal transduction histidine kinase